MATSISKAQSAVSFQDTGRLVNACRGCFAFNVELHPVEDNVAKLFRYIAGGKCVAVDRTMQTRVCEECLQFLRTVNYFVLYCRRLQRTMTELLRRKTLPSDGDLKCLFDELLRLHPIANTDNAKLDIHQAILDVEGSDVWNLHQRSKKTRMFVEDIKGHYNTIQNAFEVSEVKVEFNDQSINVNSDTSSKKNVCNPVSIDANCGVQRSVPSEIPTTKEALDEPQDAEDFDFDTSDISDDIKIESSNETDKDEDASQVKDETPSKISKKNIVQTVKIRKKVSKLKNLTKLTKSRVTNKVGKKENAKIIKKDLNSEDFEYNFGPKVDPTKTKVIMLNLQEQKADMEKNKEIGHYECSPYKCEMCYKSFTCSKTLTKHMQLHDESAGKFECPLCHRRFEKERFCRRHVLDTHTRRFKCLLCDNVAKSPSAMKTHQDTHAGKSYQCPDCGLTFRFPSSYYSHIRKKHPTDTVCNICGEGFLSKAGLTMHKRRTHGIILPNKSQDNTKISMLSTDDLEAEKDREGTLETEKALTEVNDLPKWRCDDCKITFDTLESFQTHLVRSKKHGSQLKNTCVICKDTFPTSELCEEHLKTHVAKSTESNSVEYNHAISKNNRCKACGQVFKSRALLSEHKRIHEAGGPLACHACHEEFPTKLQLRAHSKYCVWPQKRVRSDMVSRKFSCEICKKRFTAKGNLEIHMRIHTGARPFQCDVCSMTFSMQQNLKRHMLVHTGEKPHQCLQCGKCFTQRGSMKLHVRTVHMKMQAPRRVRKRIPKPREMLTRDER